MAKTTQELLTSLGIKARNESICTGREWVTSLGTETVEVHTPVTGEKLGEAVYASESEYEHVIKKAQEAAAHWKTVPAPQRGDIVRQYGEKLRLRKNDLGKLVSLEMGKSYQEGLGEVQEMIDICDFAVGLSRQLYGLTMHSERPEHRMYEQWHPVGLVGVISAFNFPVAVWAWNSMIAAVCGDVTIWKPSEKTPLTAIACHQLMQEVIIENELPEGLFNLVIGDYKIGEAMAKDKRVPLISATGSTRMGRRVSQVVGARLGKSLLELGGNNAIIITPNANVENALVAAVFGAVGTAGQRCTSTRRVLIHESIFESFKNKMVNAYGQLQIGDPLNETNHVGPLIDTDAVNSFINAVKAVEDEGGQILVGGEVLSGKGYESGCYVRPCIAEARNHFEIVQEETFAPIVYLIPYKTLDEAILMQNDVKQGLSSAIFTDNLLEAEKFLSAAGSDCGIANVNIGTSGAEIGGAFGGEKETGGGRESGSDAWKVYMRRQTNTINYGKTLPLAQGIKFEL
ncbi:MAG: aldehyde dehydrogenase family protein [Bacteroidetes bacterium]|jgi:aldehyde dehydrogenase (NAD+)|nr:aldehyde dehydrogenase family protein [Bacteroidota bacterium]MDA8930707.1 aldehyde dehydrogenase family protein [Bacteroidia bacterium]